MSDDAVMDLLARLSSGRVDVAWSEFLDRYSPLIRRVIRRHGLGEDSAAECFNHVCGALSDDGFRRLLSFRAEGPARFTTWLRAVTANLCVDWRRREEGRGRPPLCVSRLPELDQQVYRCIFVRRMSRAHCLEVLAPQYPGLTEATVAAVNARLFGMLTPQQRWQTSLRPPALTSVRHISAGPEEDDPACQLVTHDPGPDDVVAELQEQRQLQDALAQLPAEQRLLLRLRYEQNLTLVEVARLTRQTDPFRVNRQIQAALQALASLMGDRRLQPARKT